jgi:glucose/mannose-6-phosphate isomerase
VTGTARSSLPVDSFGMWEATAGLDQQVAAAIDEAGAADLCGLDDAGPFQSVVVLGMGGSGIAGDVVAAIGSPRLAVPVTVVKSYGVPACVGRDTLVFAVSCSGDTEETVAAAADARTRGAAVVTVAGGGELAAVARSCGSPLVHVPAGIPQPRAGFGALSVPPLVVLERLGLLEGTRARLEATVGVLARSRDLLVQPGSVAERLARQIGRTIPLVHGGSGPTAVAALRWKTQVNENAKSPAFVSLQPELCHNEVAGWGQHGDVTRQALTVVMLRYDGEHPRVARRFSLVKELLHEVVASVVEVRTDASDDVSALFDLVLLGDFVSLHLAGNEGVDPGPVPVLGELKARLASWTA